MLPMARQHAGGVGIPAILFGSGAAIPSEHPDLVLTGYPERLNLCPGMPPAPPQQGKTIKPLKYLATYAG